MKSIPVFFICTISIISCSSRPAIDRDIIPEDSIYTDSINENCAYIVSRNFEASLAEIKETAWSGILKNTAFIKEDAGGYRIPKFAAFSLIVKNTGDSSFDLGEIKLKYNNAYFQRLTEEYLSGKYAPPAYTALNYSGILGMYKLDTEDLCDNNIDYRKDISVNSGNSIQPGDTAFQIIIFDRIPLEVRKFSIQAEIKSDIIQKVIDFKMMRFEYRKSGKYFIKPKRDSLY